MESIEQSLLELKTKLSHSMPVLQQERAIDDILARYKTESALVAENTSKLAKLESENAALSQENRKLRGEDLEASTLQVLKLLFVRYIDLTFQEIYTTLNIHPSEALYCIEQLEERNYIYSTYQTPKTFAIHTGGRAYIVKHDLVNECDDLPPPF